VVGEENDHAFLSAVAVYMYFLTQQSEAPHITCFCSPTEPAGVSDEIPCFFSTSEPARCQGPGGDSGESQRND
jgi:hypothetical protein